MRPMIRLLCLLVVMLTAGVSAPSSLAAQPSALPQTASAGSVSPAGQGYVPINPARLLDTRNGGTAPAAGTTVTTPVLGRSGIPANGVSAVVVNLTAVAPESAGYVTAFASGTAAPRVSNLNFPAYATVANQAVVQVGADGRIALRTSATSHLLIDVVGYFASTSGYRPLEPRRVMDTRPSTPLSAGTARTVSIGGLPTTGVAAVVVNVTTVGSRSAGYLTVYPGGTARPTVSSVNYNAGSTVAGLSITKGATVAVYSSATSHLLVDVVGWIAAGGDYAPLVPTRVQDTRTTNRVAAGKQIDVPLIGVAGVPVDHVSAVEINVTAVKPAAAGWLIVHPTGRRPGSSTLNFAKGSSTANSTTAKLGFHGQISIYSSTTTDVIVDVVGYFPSPRRTPSWSSKQSLSPESGTAPTSGTLHCPTTDGCLALGVDRTSTWVLPTGESPRRAADEPTAADPGPVLTDCVSIDWCLRVFDGGETYVFDGSSWREVLRPSPASFMLRQFGLSCTSRTACLLLTFDGTYRWDGKVWARIADTISGPNSFIDCATATFCVATLVGSASVWNGRTWSAPVTFDSNDAHSAGIPTCPVAGFCMAGGSYGMGYLYRNGSWTAERLWTFTSSRPWISCGSSTFCMTGDKVWDSGVWRTTDPIPGGNGPQCAIRDWCVTGTPAEYYEYR